MAVRMLPPRLAILDTRCAKPPPKEADAELLTAEHRAWRSAVLKRAGFKCEVCGASGVRLYADHIVERQDGGAALDPDNGQCLCGKHHTLKTARVRAERMARPA